MGRWLAPLLPGPQHWVLHDRDGELLRGCAAALPGPAADGAAVTIETRCSDIGQLAADELAGATLITASALLDMLSARELARLAHLRVATACPALITLSVVGRVELTPSEPLDRRVAAAFDAHQRRVTERGRLLGPDAAAAAIEQFGRSGARVLTSRSPWCLGPEHTALALEWFAGWLGAACEQEPELAGQTDEYMCRRREQATAGQLAVTVGHLDLLVLPGEPPLGRSHPADSGMSSV
jgi:hypothetical protein